MIETEYENAWIVENEFIHRFRNLLTDKSWKLNLRSQKFYEYSYSLDDERYMLQPGIPHGKRVLYD